MELSTIYEPIKADLNKVEDRLRSVVKVDFPRQSKMLRHSLKGGGKRIRPALTILSGKFYNYNPDFILPMATAVELMHTATLVHDDAIDKSSIRRGRPTINNLWDDDKAVLLGDYLFAKAGEFSTDTQNVRVIRLFTQTLMAISSGELNQAFDAFNLKQTYQNYLQRISYKTAALFSLATESGAILSQAPEESVKVLKEYGNNLGIAFQIVDDILDFTGTESEIGKPIGSDLAQGTLTLPAILLMKRSPKDNPVKRSLQKVDRQENIKLAIEQIRNSPIIDECYEVASGYCDKACENLKPLPPNASRQVLEELAQYVVKRNK